MNIKNIIEKLFSLKKKYNLDDGEWDETKHIRAPKGSLIIGKKGKENGRVIAGGGRWVKVNDILNRYDPEIAKAIEEQKPHAVQNPKEDDNKYKKENYESYIITTEQLKEKLLYILSGDDKNDTIRHKLEEHIDEYCKQNEIKPSIKLFELLGFKKLDTFYDELRLLKPYGEAIKKVNSAKKLTNKTLEKIFEETFIPHVFDDINDTPATPIQKVKQDKSFAKSIEFLQINKDDSLELIEFKLYSRKKIDKILANDDKIINNRRSRKKGSYDEYPIIKRIDYEPNPKNIPSKILDNDYLNIHNNFQVYISNNKANIENYIKHNNERKDDLERLLKKYGAFGTVKDIFTEGKDPTKVTLPKNQTIDSIKSGITHFTKIKTEINTASKIKDKKRKEDALARITTRVENLTKQFINFINNNIENNTPSNENDIYTVLEKIPFEFLDSNTITILKDTMLNSKYNISKLNKKLWDSTIIKKGDSKEIVNNKLNLRKSEQDYAKKLINSSLTKLTEENDSEINELVDLLPQIDIETLNDFFSNTEIKKNVKNTFSKKIFEKLYENSSYSGYTHSEFEYHDPNKLNTSTQKFDEQAKYLNAFAESFIKQDIDDMSETLTDYTETLVNNIINNKTPSDKIPPKALTYVLKTINSLISSNKISDSEQIKKLNSSLSKIIDKSKEIATNNTNNLNALRFIYAFQNSELKTIDGQDSSEFIDSLYEEIKSSVKDTPVKFSCMEEQHALQIHLKQDQEVFEYYGGKHGGKTVHTNKYLYDLSYSWADYVESLSLGRINVYNIYNYPDVLDELIFQDYIEELATEEEKKEFELLPYTKKIERIHSVYSEDEIKRKLSTIKNPERKKILQEHIIKAIKLMDSQMKECPFNLSFRREISSGELEYATGLDKDAITYIVNTSKAKQVEINSLERKIKQAEKIIANFKSNGAQKQKAQEDIDSYRKQIEEHNKDIKDFIELIQTQSSLSWTNPTFQSITSDDNSVFNRDILLEYNVKKDTNILFAGHNPNEFESVLGRNSSLTVSENGGVKRIEWDPDRKQVVITLDVCNNNENPPMTIEEIIDAHENSEKEYADSHGGKEYLPEIPSSSTVSNIIKKSMENGKQLVGEKNIKKKPQNTDSSDKDIYDLILKYKRIKQKYEILNKLKEIKKKYNFT